MTTRFDIGEDAARHDPDYSASLTTNVSNMQASVSPELHALAERHAREWRQSSDANSLRAFEAETKLVRLKFWVCVEGLAILTLLYYVGVLILRK